MIKIKFTGWNIGMQQLKFIHLLNEKAGISPLDSFYIKEKVLNGEPVTISVLNVEIANQIVMEAIEYGVKTEIC